MLQIIFAQGHKNFLGGPETGCMEIKHILNIISDFHSFFLLFSWNIKKSYKLFYSFLILVSS